MSIASDIHSYDDCLTIIGRKERVPSETQNDQKGRNAIFIIVHLIGLRSGY